MPASGRIGKQARTPICGKDFENLAAGGTAA
jgi:hypothetical protein